MSYKHTAWVDCHKWKKVLGIGLWTAMTFGLCVGWYEMFEYGLIHYDDKWHGFCHEVYNYNNGVDSSSCDLTLSDPKLVAGLVFSNLSTWFNFWMIWRELNYRYRILEIKCGKKPDVTYE